MWTLFFGSVVNKTLFGMDNMTDIGLYPLLFHFCVVIITEFYLIKKIRLYLIEVKVNMLCNGFRPKHLLCFIKIVFLIYFVAFDFYHQNVIPTLINGGLIKIHLIKLLLSRNIIRNIAKILGFIFNPFVSRGEEPFFSTSIFQIIAKFFHAMFILLTGKTNTLIKSMKF